MTRAELIEAMARAIGAAAHSRHGSTCMAWAVSPDREDCLVFATAALSAIEQAGMVVAPTGPTDEMLNAAFDVYEINVIGSTFSTGRQVRDAIYRAMIEAGRIK